MMGPEEVLIQGKNVSVNGQRIPDGESRLLQGKELWGAGDCPGPHLFPWDSLPIPQSRGQQKGQLGGSLLLHPHYCWAVFGNEGAC